MKTKRMKVDLLVAVVDVVETVLLIAGIFVGEMLHIPPHLVKGRLVKVLV